MTFALLAALVQPGLSHETNGDASDVTIESRVARLGATVLVPHGDQRVPCAVIVGGTLSQDRDGRMTRDGVPPRDALWRLAEALAAGGYASIRFDRVGYGKSRPGDAWQGTYADEAAALAAVIDFTRRDRRFTKVIVIGESAGGYLACLAAKAGTQADACVFLGAHCGPGAEIYEYNFGRLVEHVAAYPENRAWAEALRLELALGRQYREMFEAAAAGRDTFELVDGDFRHIVGLARRREELDMPPDRMFGHITAPVLALAGEYDLNVAPAHARRIVEILRQAGNERGEFAIVEGVDHSFQQAADTEHARMRERFTLESFRRPYSVETYRKVIDWLRDTVPTPLEFHADHLETIAGATEPAADKPLEPVRAEGGVEIDAVTAASPERIHLAPGIQIVDNVTDKSKTAGVETLEGRIGPLLLAEGSQAHFIDMPAGMYVEEHPHSSESLIFTVRGKWVLCSRGRRHVMRPGSLFRFAAGVPTGYEIPWDEDAYILIFKGDRLTATDQEFVSYLEGLAKRLREEQESGVPFLLRDLPADHVARKFAQQVNPEFEQPNESNR